MKRKRIRQPIPSPELKTVRARLTSEQITSFWQKCFLSTFAIAEHKDLLKQVLFVSSLSTDNIINHYKNGEYKSVDIRKRLGIPLKEGDYFLLDKYKLVIFVIFIEVELKASSLDKIGHRQGHYSLLVLYSGRPSAIYYYDSVLNCSLPSCTILIYALKRAFLVENDINLVRIMNYPQQIDTFECGYIVCMMIQSLMVHFLTIKKEDKMDAIPVREYPLITDKQLDIVEKYIHLDFYNYYLDCFIDRWNHSTTMPDIPHMDDFD